MSEMLWKGFSMADVGATDSLLSTRVRTRGQGSIGLGHAESVAGRLREEVADDDSRFVPNGAQEESE